MSNLNNIEPNNAFLSEGNIQDQDDESNTNMQNNNQQNDEISPHIDEDPVGNTPLPESYNIEFYKLCKLYSKLGVYILFILYEFPFNNESVIDLPEITP